MSRTRNFGNGVFVFFAVLVCMAFGLTACQVGLGAAVDTSDPRAGIITPSVSYPSVGGPTIHIAGSCEDDTGIAEIRIVQLRNVETGEEYNDLGNAVLSENGREWSFDLIRSGTSGSTYSVNDRELKLQDGRYELTIIPVDLGGRTPRYGVTRTIEIDNTPPIFLISSPNSTNISDPAPFGQTVKVKGVPIDDHEIKSMEVKVYDTVGSRVTIAETGDLERVQSKDKDNFSIILAKKTYKPSETPDEAALDNYDVLYPTGTNGQKYYYMEVVLEDSVNMGTDLPGNKSRLVYFKTPLFDKLRDLGINIVDSVELKRGYNGTSSIFSAQQCETIRQVLDGTYDDDTSYYAKVSETSDGRLAFSVNPNNNPKYSFGGMAYSDNNPVTWRTNKAAAGGTVTLMVSASSDEEDDRILPSTIVVKLIPVDNDGNKLYGQALLSTSANGPSLELGSTPVETATYTVTLPDDLNYTYYSLEVTGQDGQGKDLEANATGYGFMLYSNKIPVTITTEDDQKYMAKSDGNTYPFNISVTDPNSLVTINTTGSVRYQVQTDNTHRAKSSYTTESWNGLAEHEATLTAGGEAGSFTSEIGVSYSVPTEGVGTIALRIWGDNGVESDKNVYVLYIDNRKPALTVNNAAELTGGLVKEDSTYYTAGEGKYTISGTWRDVDGSGARKLEYKWGNESWTPVGVEYSGASHVTESLNWSISRTVTDASGITIIIRATDQVGNTTEDAAYTYSGVTFDLGDPVFTVVPEETKADFFRTTRDFTAVATDGFGLQEITAVAKQGETTVASGSNGYSLTVTDTVAGNNKSKTATVRIAPASNADGEWEIELTAKDLNGRTSKARFGFTFDQTKPDASIEDSLPEWQRDRSARISGAVNEAVSLKNLYYLVRKSGESQIIVTADTDISGMAGVQSLAYTNRKGSAIPFSITVDELTDNLSHGNVVYVQPVDEAGNRGIVRTVEVNVDQAVPELEALKYSIAGGETGNATGTIAVNSSALTLYGTYSDTASGVGELGIEIGSTSVTTQADIRYTTDAVNATSITEAGIGWNEYNSSQSTEIKGWKATIPAGALANGTVKINGRDAAGNTASHYSVTLKKDTTKPTVSNVTIEGENVYRQNDTTYWVKKVDDQTTQIAVKGVSADDYALKDTVITIEDLAPITRTGASWTTGSTDISGLTGSSATVSVVSRDSAGNLSDPTEITLKFDETAPSRNKTVNTRDTVGWGTADNWEDLQLEIGSGHYYLESYSGSTSLRVGGRFTEEGSGIKAVYYELVSGTEAHTMTAANYQTFSSVVPAADGSFSTTITGLQEGSNNLRIIAVDNVGNVSRITDSAYKYESDFVLGLDQMSPSFGNGFTLDGSDEYVTGTQDFTITGGTVSDDLAGVDPSTIKFWFVDKNNPSTKYTITRTAGTYGQLIYDQTDPDDKNRSADITINVTPGTWFTEANLGSSPILYGTMNDYSTPANSAGTVTILTTLKLDQTVPEIAIDNNLNTTPITDENDGGKIRKVGEDYFYELTGTWSDANGSGTDKLYYSINNGTAWVDADTLATKNYAKSKAESAWSLSIPVTEGTSYTFAVKAKDAAGNEKEAKPNKTVTFDFSKPTITVDTDSGIYGGTRPQATITANDHYQISDITVVSATKNGSAAASGTDYVLSAIAGGGTATATRVVTIETDGVFEFTFKATDVNNRDSDTITRTWTVDTVAPAPKADNDATYGLRINGEAAGTWYRDTNLRFDGRVDEKISGLSKVYYIVSTENNVTVDAVKAGSQQNYSNLKNTGAGGTVPVAYSVTPTVTDGTSYVHMVFEDLAGNTSTVKTSMIKLDRHAPTFTKDYYSYEENTNYSAIGGTVLSNKSKNLYVAGSYSDDDSGVKELKFDINGVTLVAGTDIEIKYSTVAIEENAANISSMSSSWKSYSEIADKTSIKSYRAMINKAKLAAGSVGVETADVTGNSSTQTIFTITIDETAPVLTLNTPKTKCVSPNDDENVNTVNGTITFAGTTEESSMDHLDLYWGTTSSATADINSDHLIATKAAAQSYNWSFTVPLSSVESNSVQFIDESSYAGSPKDIYLKAIAVDKAGNTAKYVYKYSVNPDDDRPIITFTQLDLTGLTEDSATSSVWLKDNKTMTGSVTDDDGVTSLKYRKKTYNSSTDIWSDWTGWTACSVTNGNFTIPFTDETKYSLEFKVTDGAGTEFTTVVDGNQYLAPKFVDQNGVGSDYSILNLAVDITSPNISDVKYIANNGADEAASTDFTLNRFGGDWKKFKLQFDAADNNGIKSAKVIFNGKEYTATNTSGHTYSTGYIPLDKVDDGSNTPLPSGNYTATIIATDNADREGRDSMKASFVVDNDAPTVRISQPNGLVSMATQAVGSLSEVNGLAHVYFMVTQKNANPVSVNDYATAEQNGANRWKEYANLETGTSSFEIAFDSGNGDNHTDLLKWYLAYVGLTTIDAINGTNGATRFTDLTEIDLHIKAVDSYGNVGYGKKTVQVDPQGDKPTVTITYPLADSTLGGAIPIMGTAIDNVSADNVMVLIDMNDDGKWNKADIEALGALNPVPSWLTWGKFDLNPSTEKYEWTGITYAQIISETTSLGPNDAGWTKYGIKKTVNNASWSFTVNQGGELNPSGSTARRNLALWVYSTDTDGNSSQINLTDHTKMPYVSFIIDKDTPQITNEYLVQYDNSGTFTESHVTAKYAYTKDMSIKGEWYYEADMTDESGLEKVTRYTISDGASIDSVEMTSAGTYVGGDIVLSEITNGYHIRMKVGSNTDDEVVKQNWKIACQESDGQHLSGESEIALNVDNKAPDVIETGDFYNIGQAVTINGDDYRKVTNENGFFTFGTQAKEDAVARVSQTGVKRIAFYFTRDINTTHQLYDVMIAKGGTGNALDGYTGLSKNDGLYWKNLTGTASGKTFTLSGSDPNVHTGGLVKIKGVIYRIEGVSGRTVTIEVNTTEENPFSGVTSAEFALANVVDNPTEENADENSGKTAGYYNHVNFDDGDLMVESLKKQGTTWTWEANINSKNIGDGKAVLHYVVFDAAGNSVEKTVDVFVANNQPRIAGVSIGTDTNGNGTVDASEMISEGYSNIYAKGKQGSKIMTEAWFPSDKASSVLKIMGNTRIKPEIVGGNGQLDYSYAAYASNGAGSWSDTPLINGNGTAIGTGSAVGTEAGETEDAQALTVDFTMAQLLGMGNAENTKFALTVSDQTPGASLSATLNIIVDTLLLDNNPPRSRILPFYWVDKDTNSLFKQSRDYGHIELPVDLPDSFTEGGTGVDDRDPKLSGIVKIEGIARDDVLLSELKVKVGANEYTLGTYNGSWNVTNEWDGSTIPTGTYAARITNATYRDAYNMGFIPEADFNALSDMVKDTAIDYVTAKYGHIVHWTLYLDTASFVTGTDIAIMASASDRGRATSSAGNVTYTPNTWTEENEASHSASANVSDSGTPTGYQKVDIVPYIAKVYTGLAKLKNINWSVFNRTSLGHYAVASNETVYLYGFNLGNSTNKPKYGAVELNAPVNGGTSNSAYPSGASYASYSVVAFPVSNVTASGEITITVGDTSTLNNLNKSDAKGSYSGTTSSLTGDKSIYDNYYNRQPNGDNNNLLTDDLVLDVWDVNSKVGKPAAGALSQPVMDIDPISGKVGFAFRNGALMMSMGSQNYSYDYWLCGLDVWTSIGFVYDDLGYGWGTAAGGDINNTSADSFALISSRWGTGTLRNTDTGHNNGTNQIRPYTIGQKDYDENGSSFVNIDKERFQSPTLATTVEGTASTVYLAYYDNINNEIRFHWGTFTTNTKTASMVQDLFSDAYGKNNALNGKDITQDYAQYRLDYTSLIAGQTQNAHPFTGTPTDTRVYATDGTPVCAGQYVSIAALKGKGNIVNGVADDAVIAVWYDAANNQLLYSYNKAPKSITAGQFLQADTGWSKPVAIFGAGNGIGEYCKIAADKNGGAHIVAYDSLNADVVYAYIPSFDAPANAVTCIVDSYGLIGTELDIDVALDDDENPLPFISYYAGSNAKPKTARWSGKTALTTSNLAAGSENEMFTGTWDISLIPTNSKIAVDHINVGIWKDKSTGIIKNSTEGTNLVEQTGASYNSSVSRGNIFGNGSKNAILGYAINEGASGYIETAQMK